jgi:glucose-6-phosphate 1-dehydrogenase
VKPCDLLLFGGQGDLSRRKLIPSLYRLETAGLIAPETAIVGVDRGELADEGFVAQVRENLATFMMEGVDAAVWERFARRLRFAKVDLSQRDQYGRLREKVDPALHETVGYCAVPPGLVGPICQGLAAAGLATDRARVVLEKPIGTDFASSRAINDSVGAVFPERQVYRIDHYLGKETVLNLLALRFANSLFTTNWDHNTIDHVQITVAEEVGIEGRWGYFDASGQLRDMVQNHLLQILTLVAIEPPAVLDGDSVRDEKLKVLRALRPITRDNVEEKTVRGQYAAGHFQGKPVPGYLEEEGGNPRSATETFAALRVDIDNWRWADVPFYLRTGKRLASKRSEIVVQFRNLPHNIFQASYRKLPANRLIIRLQPDEGVEIDVLNKVPGLEKGVRLQRSTLDLSFTEAFKSIRIPDAYERLLLEVMQANQTLFIRRDEVEQAWTWIDSIQDAWRALGESPKPYPAGSWGPAASVAMLSRDGREWVE